jgi:hypothetical protein
MLVIAFAAGLAGGGQAFQPSREQLVKQLADCENAVRSYYIAYDVTVKVPTPEMKSRIADVLVRRGMEKEVRRYLIGPPFADKNSHAFERWNKDSRFRWQQKRPTGLGQEVTWAFDGRVNRTVVHDGKAVRATIFPPENAGAKERDPFELLVRDRDLKWSEIVASGARAALAAADDLPGGTRVVVDNPRKGDYCLWFELTFDEHGRMISRVEYGCFGDKDSKPRLMEAYAYGDYRRCTDTYGQQMCVPFKTEVDYCVGTTADGKRAVWKSTVMAVRKFELNVDIDDAFFIPDLPAGATIENELGGAPEPGVDATVAWFARLPDAPATTIKWRPWAIAALLPFAVAVLAVFVWSRRKAQT